MFDLVVPSDRLGSHTVHLCWKADSDLFGMGGLEVSTHWGNGWMCMWNGKLIYSTIHRSSPMDCSGGAAADQVREWGAWGQGPALQEGRLQGTRNTRYKINIVVFIHGFIRFGKYHPFSGCTPLARSLHILHAKHVYIQSCMSGIRFIPVRVSGKLFGHTDFWIIVMGVAGLDAADLRRTRARRAVRPAHRQVRAITIMYILTRLSIVFFYWICMDISVCTYTSVVLYDVKYMKYTKTRWRHQ